MFTLIVLIFSLVLGSFLNVVIYRLPRGESLLFPGSRCPSCGKGLKPGDLIPVLSYLWLRGRCRYCGERIAGRYPLVELLTALTFTLVFLKEGWSLGSAAGWVLTAILIVAAFIDIDQGIIPDRLSYPGIVLGLAFSPIAIGWKSSLGGMLLFAGFYLLVAILSRGGLGGGDVKLAGVLGAFAGINGAFMTMVLSSLLGGLWAAYLLIRGKAHRKTALPFGPFLAIAGWLVWMYGEKIMTFYFNLLT